MTAQTAARNLEHAIRDDRDAARRDYAARGLAAYLDRGALRSDLCLAIALADEVRGMTLLTLSEVYGLQAAGLLDDQHRLTQGGREAAAVARIARAL